MLTNSGDPDQMLHLLWICKVLTLFLTWHIQVKMLQHSVEAPALQLALGMPQATTNIQKLKPFTVKPVLSSHSKNRKYRDLSDKW